MSAREAHMQKAPDPILYKDLAEAKAALARHGIVIIRSIETDLEPAIMVEARDAISASPQALEELDEGELDELMDDIRKKALKSADDLKRLYTRVLAQLGTEYIVDVVKDLDGIEALFTWERAAKSVDPVNDRLAEAGFGPIRLQDPEAISESFALELNERWPVSFSRFRDLANEAAGRQAEADAARKKTASAARGRPQGKSRRSKGKPKAKKKSG